MELIRYITRTWTMNIEGGQRTDGTNIKNGQENRKKERLRKMSCKGYKDASPKVQHKSKSVSLT